ncbi:MAG: hypothetical protein KatS3mg110_0025 [Pirellulaceae bacterium]|nr:MAG: hypothetical protein KatS3mg110_0025 [Pirellulaceae bacterium]
MKLGGSLRRGQAVRSTCPRTRQMLWVLASTYVGSDQGNVARRRWLRLSDKVPVARMPAELESIMRRSNNGF